MQYEKVVLEQGTTEWHAWRKEGITATDAVVLAGRSPYKSVYRLWGEKMGFIAEADIGANPYVRRGNELEPEARDHMADFLLDHDPSEEIVRQAGRYLKEPLTPWCIQSKQYPMLRASLDGLRANGEPTELKVPSERTFEDVRQHGTDSKAYKLYYPQVQHQIMVTGAKQGWLLFYQPDRNVQPICFRVPRDKDFISENIKRCSWFYKLMQSRTAPPKDKQKDVYYPGTEAEAEAWILHAPAVQRLEQTRQHLKRQIDAIEESLEVHKEALAQAMGAYKAGEYAGVRMTCTQRQPAVKWEQLIEAETDLTLTDEMKDKYRGSVGRESRRITITGKPLPKDYTDPRALEWLEPYLDDRGDISFQPPSRSGFF